MKSNALLFISVVFLFGLLLVQGEKQNQLELRIAYTDAKYYEVQAKLEETEEKCLRMTDTCIDIIANRRWEDAE